MAKVTPEVANSTTSGDSGGEIRVNSNGKTSTIIRVNAESKSPGEEDRRPSPMISKNVSMLENSGIDYGVNVVTAPTPPPAPKPPSPPSPPTPTKITHFPSGRRTEEVRTNGELAPETPRSVYSGGSNGTLAPKAQQNMLPSPNLSLDEEDSNLGKKSPDPIISKAPR